MANLYPAYDLRLWHDDGDDVHVQPRKPGVKLSYIILTL